MPRKRLDRPNSDSASPPASEEDPGTSTGPRPGSLSPFQHGQQIRAKYDSKVSSSTPAQSSDDEERGRMREAINARKARGGLDRSRAPAQKKADREERRQAHAVRAAERARKVRGVDLP